MPLLFAYGINRFSHDLAQLLLRMNRLYKTESGIFIACAISCFQKISFSELIVNVLIRYYSNLFWGFSNSLRDEMWSMHLMFTFLEQSI